MLSDSDTQSHHIKSNINLTFSDSHDNNKYDYHKHTY